MLKRQIDRTREVRIHFPVTRTQGDAVAKACRRLNVSRSALAYAALAAATNDYRDFDHLAAYLPHRIHVLASEELDNDSSEIT